MRVSAFIRHALFLPVFLSWSSSALSAQGPAQLALVRGGKSVYSIVIPQLPTQVERSSATVIQQYLLKISGALLPIVRDTAPPSPYEVRIGSARHFTDSAGTSTMPLDPDGTMIRTDGQTLILRGGSGKGVLYGVYSLLEDYLGCRRYTPTVEVIPHHATVTLPFINVRYNPPFRFRETLCNGCSDQAFADWHKLVSLDDQRQEWGMWVHTFDILLPTKEFFTQHPEYFSLVGGRRIPSGQLCLSNPDVATIHSIDAGFLQYWYAWIWLPTKVDFSVSQDGKSFTNICTLVDTIPDTTSGAFAKSFDARFSPVRARYVHVHAYSRLRCPDWHIGAGQKSWIFCDEVVVQ